MKLVLVIGAVVFGTLALASPAVAAVASDSGTAGSPGSIAVPTVLEP